MYKDYLKETYNLNTLESDVGFVTYRIEHGDLHIEDVYVKPDARNGESRKEIIRELTKSIPMDFIEDITISLDSEQKNSDDMLVYLLINGFKFAHSFRRLNSHDSEILLYIKKEDFIKRLG